MVPFTDALPDVSCGVFFMQYLYPEETNRYYALVDNACIVNQHYYNRCFMDDLQT